jgi:GNAT superfamily N-acetyltransferase
MIVNKYEFRKLNKGEFCEASDLIWSVFNEFEAPEYSNEGIHTFKEFINSDKLYENSEKGFMNFWACFDHQKLIGIIASRESCHISLLFVKKEYHHKGIARELFNKLKTEIVENNPNSKCITVNSSPFAFQIYIKLGFTPTDKEQIQDGLRFIPMKYALLKY